MSSTVDQPQQLALGSNLDYPTRDGRPMAETDLHRDMMFDVIAALQAYYAGQPVYVTGNLLVFYEPGNKRRHVSPDCMVVKGLVPTGHPNYLIWEEGKSADVVIEITSRTTRKEDIKKKFDIYRTIMRVPEYFLFDPTGDYLSPRLQGYRLVDDQYVPIEPAGGRLHSEELGLFLEGEEIPDWRDRLKAFKLKRPAAQLRFFNPATGRNLPTIAESLQIARQRADEAEQEALQAEQAKQQAEHERLQAEQDRLQAEREKRQAQLAKHHAEQARQQAEQAKQQAEQAKQQSDAENERLKRELEELRRRI